jgi:uncharacterized protein YjiS (DUF1127 family)
VDAKKAEDAKKKAQQYNEWLQNRTSLRELDQLTLKASPYSKTPVKFQ